MLIPNRNSLWGAISFSFIKKRSNHPEVCPSGKGNSPCRRLASGRTLCGEFANRSCCRKRPTWVASPKQKHPCWGAFVLEAPPGIGPGIKVLQTSALPLGYGAIFHCYARARRDMLSRSISTGKPALRRFSSGAGNGARTRYLNLGKVALYQMS